MRVLVTGARDWRTPALVHNALNQVQPTVVVHGDAKGVDQDAGNWARIHKVPVEVHPLVEHADAKRRNQYMVDLGADLCVAFATHWASGTGQTARMARRAGIEVRDYGVDTREEARP